MNDQTIIALITTLGAITAAFFTLRGAARTAQPSAQDALNAGFTALTERQLTELLQLRAETAARFEEQERRHRREMENLRVDLTRQINQKVEQEHNRLKARIHHLEDVLERAGIAIPAWTAVEEG